MVEGRGAGVISGVGVAREARGRVAPGLLEGRVQQVAAEAAADAVRHEAEVGEVDGAPVDRGLAAAVELEVAGRGAVAVEHEDLDAVVRENAGEIRVAHLPAVDRKSTRLNSSH